MQGFLVFDYADRYHAALTDLSRWKSQGKIKTKETIIRGGIHQAEKALRDVYDGVNIGEFELMLKTKSLSNTN